jgi:hypothetical protein
MVSRDGIIYTDMASTVQIVELISFISVKLTVVTTVYNAAA